MPFVFVLGKDFDIIAADEEKAIFCECKWNNRPIGYEVLKKLIKRSSLVKFEKQYLFLFSKSGFTDECRKVAENSDNITLVTFDEMCEV